MSTLHSAMIHTMEFNKLAQIMEVA